MPRRSTFTSDQILDVVGNLIGPIHPVGESHVDNKRLVSLGIQMDVCSHLLQEICEVTTDGAQHLASVKESADLAREYLAETKQLIEQTLESGQ